MKGTGAPVNTDSRCAGTRRQPCEMSDISKYYAGVAALTDVSVDILPGEVHAILGENGAGKSTLMNVAIGDRRSLMGARITFAGTPMDSLTPRVAAALGIAIVHQHPAVLPDMTVLENLAGGAAGVGLRRTSPRTSWRGDCSTRSASTCTSNDRVESLTVAQKHLLEIAKAFALEPKVLILDEPTAPLGGAAVEMLFRRVRTSSPPVPRSSTSRTGWPRCASSPTG